MPKKKPLWDGFEVLMQGWHDRDWHRGFRPFPPLPPRETNASPMPLRDFLLGCWRIQGPSNLIMTAMFGLMFLVAGFCVTTALLVDVFAAPSSMSEQMRSRLVLLLGIVPMVIVGASCLLAVARNIASRSRRLAKSRQSRTDKSDEE